MKTICNIIAAVMMSITAVSAHAMLVETKLKTAEDGEISFYIDSSTGFPISAEDDRAKIMVAAFTVTPKAAHESAARWGFSYGIQFKDGHKPVSVKVEDETEKPKTIEVEDTSPSLIDGNWSGQSQHRLMTKKDFMALLNEQEWFFLRKFTISYADGKTSELHQLVRITGAMRRSVIEETAKLTQALKEKRSDTSAK